MRELWIALGLVLVIEGALYALFPGKMVDMARKLSEMPPATLRVAGLFGVILGWLVVWFVHT
jgi:hypothetical protein